ncbi:MAG: hypothetical protein IPJ61_19500 [Tessaracoccus sp.]|uniref:SNF2-related protein n=1 Tax=Tessaracoccus sp. TaxID=1971211 RepID=UPI001ED4B3BB|nr:SNF2-related protein [Tessaracoccus sp.]MBK7823173.1 hypothetical protein [Tessaracoccus sp.]
MDAVRPAGRWDWWTIPFEWARQLGPVPGVVYRTNGTVEVHRTHLPLLAAHGHPIPELTVGVPPVLPKSLTLRPWQTRARTWMADRRGSLVVAEPRLGKTPLALSLHEPNGLLMILAPLDVREVWLTWIERMFPGARAETLVLEGTVPDIEKLRRTRFVFAHYDILTHQQVTSVRPRTLIVDEIHLLSNPTSQRTKAVRFFAGLADRVIALTGTPLWNKTRGLGPLLAITNPGAWGSHHEFSQRYASPTMGEYGWVYGELSNREEFMQRRTEVVFEARWSTEAPELPATNYEVVDVPVSADDLAVLDETAAEMRGALLDTDDNTIGALARYRQATGVIKIETVVERAMAYAKPLVIWGWHKQRVIKKIADRLKKQGRATFMLHGDLSIQKRTEALDAWRASPDGILCATLAVGQVGLDLSHATTAFVVEIDWTPAVTYQTTMRTFDASRPMTIVFFRVDHPVERMLVDSTRAKMQRADVSAMPAAGSAFRIDVPQDVDDGSVLDELRALLAGRSADFTTWV